MFDDSVANQLEANPAAARNMTPRLSNAPSPLSSHPNSSRRSSVGASPASTPMSGAGAADLANGKRSTWTGRDADGRLLRGSILEAGFAVLGVPTGVDMAQHGTANPMPGSLPY